MSKFLTVKQITPTVATCKLADGREVQNNLRRALPGRRDGTLLLGSKTSRRCFASNWKWMTQHIPHPYVFKTSDNSNFVLIHVDDILVVGRREFVPQKLGTCLQQCCELATRIMQNQVMRSVSWKNAWLGSTIPGSPLRCTTNMLIKYALCFVRIANSRTQRPLDFLKWIRWIQLAKSHQIRHGFSCVGILFVFGLWLAALPAHSEALVYLPCTAHSEKYDDAEEASCFILGMSWGHLHILETVRQNKRPPSWL